MNYDELIAWVQQEAELDSEARARETVVVTLTTLGEHVSPGQVMKLAAQLPPEIRYPLQQQDDPAQDFDLDAFLARIGEREKVDRATAKTHARAVFKAVRLAVDPDQFEDTMAQLPKEFTALVE